MHVIFLVFIFSEALKGDEKIKFDSGVSSYKVTFISIKV